MLTLKEPESEVVYENTAAPQEEQGNISDAAAPESSAYTLSNGQILENALLSITQDDNECQEQEISGGTSSLAPESCDPAAIAQWADLKEDASVSYVASVPNGKEFIIITRLEPVQDKALITGKALTLTEDPLEKKVRSRSKRHNKVLLLRKIVPKTEAELNNQESGDVVNEAKEDRVPIVDELSYTNANLDDVVDRGKETKEGTGWLKSFRPLPLYYTDRGKPYLKCPACGAMFFTSSFFQKHLFSHIQKGEEEDTYICSFCSYTRSEPGMLFTHLAKHQDQCEFCNENLMRKNNFEKHWDSCSASFCVKRDRRGRFVCAACRLVFDLLPQLEKHWFKHTCKRERAHQCRECGGLYESKETLENHKCLKCPICGEIYDNLHRLKAHTMWMKHNLKCPICSYEFILSMDHEKHLAMHREVYRPTKDHLHCLQSADGKTFQCDLCDKIFYALPRLVVHLQEDHGVEKVKKEVAELMKADVGKSCGELMLRNLKEEPIRFNTQSDTVNRLNDDDFPNVL